MVGLHSFQLMAPPCGQWYGTPSRGVQSVHQFSQFVKPPLARRHSGCISLDHYDRLSAGYPKRGIIACLGRLREAQLAGPLVHRGDAPWVSLGSPRPRQPAAPLPRLPLGDGGQDQVRVRQTAPRGLRVLLDAREIG